jgi:hypothetical protein
VARPAPGRRPNGERQKRLTPPTTPRLSHLVLQEARRRMGFPVSSAPSRSGTGHARHGRDRSNTNL